MSSNRSAVRSTGFAQKISTVVRSILSLSRRYKNEKDKD